MTEREIERERERDAATNIERITWVVFWEKYAQMASGIDVLGNLVLLSQKIRLLREKVVYAAELHALR